jgi:tol-pal system protein YbgF
MTRTSFHAIVMAGCLALGLATVAEPRPASAQSDPWNALYDRMIRLEHEVRDLQSGGGMMPGTPVSGEAGQRMAAIEDQLRRVLGALDEIRRSQEMLERRLDQLEGSPRTTGSIYDQHQPQHQPTYSQPSDQTFDFSQYQSRELAELSAEQDVTVRVYRESEPQRGAPPQVLGTLSASQIQQGQFYEQGQPFQQGQQGQFPSAGGRDDGISLVPETVERAALDGNPLPSPGPSGVSAGAEAGAGTGGTAERLYESAYESLLGRRFGAAEGSFRMFLDRHRDHPLAGDAHYWLGETYYVQGDYKQAAQSFLEGYRGFPQGRKAPETLFKLAQSLQQLDQKPQACSTFAEVAKNYPTAANVRNEALKEMQRAGC